MDILSSSITLTNDGDLWVFFLGCGSAFSRRQFQTNILVVKGQDHLLIDCGTTCSRALEAVGLSILDISTVLVTHSHADHAGGLEELILMNRYVARRKPTILIDPPYQKKLWNETLRGGAEMNERRNGRGLRFQDYLTPRRRENTEPLPRDGQLFTVGSLTVRTFRTRHYPEQATRWDDAAHSVGVVLDEQVFISGDTQFDETLIHETAPADAEWFFHDAQFFTGGIHASVDELATLPREIRQRTSLVHYGDTYEQMEGKVADAGFAGFTRAGQIHRFTPRSRDAVQLSVPFAAAAAV